jgi:hypothetical protein
VQEQQNAASKPSSACTDETNCDPAKEASYTADEQQLYAEYENAAFVHNEATWALKDAESDAARKHEALKFAIQKGVDAELQLANANGEAAMANEEWDAAKEAKRIALVDFEAKRLVVTESTLKCMEAGVKF